MPEPMTASAWESEPGRARSRAAWPRHGPARNDTTNDRAHIRLGAIDRQGIDPSAPSRSVMSKRCG